MTEPGEYIFHELLVGLGKYMMIITKKRENKGQEAEKKGEKSKFSLFLGEKYNFGKKGGG